MLGGTRAGDDPNALGLGRGWAHGVSRSFSSCQLAPNATGSLMGNESSWQLLAGPEDEKVVKSEQRVELREVGRKEKEKPHKV